MKIRLEFSKLGDMSFKGTRIFTLFFEESSHLDTSHVICRDFSHALELGAGFILYTERGPAFRVLSRFYSPFSLRPAFLLESLCDAYIHEGEFEFSYRRAPLSLAVITLSDKGFIGKREDTSGPALIKMLAEKMRTEKMLTEKMSFGRVQSFILPDEIAPLRGLVSDLAYNQNISCIVSTGGTGLSERDISPEAILPLLDKRLQGFEQAMMTKSLEKTPHAMLSRAFCGLIHKSLIISVPGSLKASTENIEAILPALPHALAKISGCMKDCQDISV